MSDLSDSLFGAVRDLPVVDWHDHLDMDALAEDHPLGSLYSVWVAPDPYKHRAMRICGEPERVITGEAPEAEKWDAWRRTLPKLVGNPLFDWAEAELELAGLSGAETRRRGAAEWIRNLENVPLSHLRPSDILRKVRAEVISPCVGAGELFTNDNCHNCPKIANANSQCRVVPSLRINVGEEVSSETLGRFHAAGCRVVDISVDDVSKLSSLVTRRSSLSRLASFAASRNWTMLLHLGALRETSSRLRAASGPAGGYAAMRAPVDPAAVAGFLDALEEQDALPHTILLTLNPEAHAQLAVLSGAFAREGSPGHVQLGPAWWWCDHAHGVRDVLEKSAAYGVLSTFVGMTTDSRSLLSLARHDWFRRVLCRWISDKVAAGDFPDDPALLRPILENVCYLNAKRIFPSDP